MGALTRPQFGWRFNRMSRGRIDLTVGLHRHAIARVERAVSLHIYRISNANLALLPVASAIRRNVFIVGMTRPLSSRAI